MLGRVRAIHVYPLKGARGIRLDEADVLATGIQHDRRFLAVSETGEALTQRTHPAMARIETAIEGDALRLEHAGEPLTVPLVPTGRRQRVRIWNDHVDAIVVADATAFLSRWMGTDATLVYVPDDALRTVEQDYARPDDRVGFADAYPILVASQSSLDDLNAKLASPVPMDRFRPNIVVDGGVPFVEETVAALALGSLHLRTPKRCARCQVVTVDQSTGVVTGKEPLRTLARYRAAANKVHFGMNAIPDLAPGLAHRLTVGTPVTAGA